MTKIPPFNPGAADDTQSWLDVVRRKVEALRFGSVQIIVHDGRVTQIESVEKTRFSTGRDDPSPLR